MTGAEPRSGRGFGAPCERFGPRQIDAERERLELREHPVEQQLVIVVGEPADEGRQRCGNRTPMPFAVEQHRVDGEPSEPVVQRIVVGGARPGIEQL